MFKQIFIVQEGQRAFLFRHGELIGFLRPGRHVMRSWRSDTYDLRTFSTESGFVRLGEVELDKVLDSRDADVLEVPTDFAALIAKDGRPERVLGPGRYILWQVGVVREFELVDLTALETAIPLPYWDLAPSELLMNVVVAPYQRALVIDGGARIGELESGRHGLSPWNRKLRIAYFDLREQELQVVGQELVTRDKVSLRLNLLGKYRVVDPAKVQDTVDNPQLALYAELQVAARDVVSAVTVDELLEKRADLGREMAEPVRDRAAQWGLELIRHDVKDVILPGDMKLLLNRVIEADKRAAAQVILRREEVAATRSLANTARLLENNPVLLRLKELEALKELAEKVGDVTIVMGGDALQRQFRFQPKASKDA